MKEHFKGALDEKMAHRLDLPDVKHLERQMAEVESEIEPLKDKFFTSIEEAEREAQEMLKSNSDRARQVSTLGFPLSKVGLPYVLVGPDNRVLQVSRVCTKV